MKKQINVGIIGCGVVGRGTVETLLTNKQSIKAKTGLDVNLSAVADINMDKKTGDPLFAQIPHKYTDAMELINNPEIDIVVELVGGYTYAKTFILTAIAQGKHIVTANKALLALHGAEIFGAAKEKGVEVGFEASVGGGIPIIKVIKEDLAANNVQEIVGIINGTANYILSRMTKEGKAYADVLKDAQAHGYAEADPAFDVEGTDSAHKITLLAMLAFGASVDFEKVYIEGITQISPADIDFAKELDSTVKLLAIAKKHSDTGKIEVRVHPTMVHNSYLLASVDDVFNAVQLTSDIAGETVHYGRGAGGRATSSAVVGDIIGIARDIAFDCVGRVPSLGYINAGKADMVDIADVSSAFYIRLNVEDTPGVLAAVAGCLAKNGISIHSALQRPVHEKTPRVPLVFLTSEISGKQLMAAIDEISTMNAVSGKPVIIRVME